MGQDTSYFEPLSKALSPQTDELVTVMSDILEGTGGLTALSAFREEQLKNEILKN